MRPKTGAALRERNGAAEAEADAGRIRSVINKLKRPDGVLNWSTEFGEDSTGEPAVWIWFHFQDEDAISQRKIDELTDFVEAVRSRLFEANLGRWPYVGFRNPRAC